MNEKGTLDLQNGVCAILVTFHPELTVEANLEAIRPQVEGLVVVDNGSSWESLSWLRDACERLSIELIEQEVNIGLPAAINVGIERATQNAYRWVVLFDQDSTATGGMIDAMLDTYKTWSFLGQIGIVAPRYISRLTRAPVPRGPRLLGGNTLDVAWTSGSLIPICVLEDVGGFEPCLVIDLLDYEFSLRLRRAGYKIILAKAASLLHEAGFPKTHKLLGMFPMRTDNHRPVRRYYRARNRVWIARKYNSNFPGLVRRNFMVQVKEVIWMLICERNRWKNLTSVICGIKDGMIGRMGKTVKL
jgi:rhamnosyltransferase